MEKRSQASFDSDADAESSTTLLDEQLLDEQLLANRSSRRSRPTAIALKLVLGLVAVACFASLMYTAVTVHKISQASEVDYGDCGSNESVEEARAKGCVFDPMGWVWVRPECYDAEMVADFLNRTEFSWHTEPKLTPESKVSMDVIFRGDHPKLFTQKKYHSVHCTVSEPCSFTPMLWFLLLLPEVSY